MDTTVKRPLDQGNQLGDRMRARRIELKLSQPRAAVRGDLSVMAWGNAERGQTIPTRATVAAIERALELEPGTLEQLLDRPLRAVKAAAPLKGDAA